MDIQRSNFGAWTQTCPSRGKGFTSSAREALKPACGMSALLMKMLTLEKLAEIYHVVTRTQYSYLPLNDPKVCSQLRFCSSGASYASIRGINPLQLLLLSQKLCFDN